MASDVTGLSSPSHIQAEADQFVADAHEFMRRATEIVVSDHRDSSALLHDGRAGISELLGRYQRFKHCEVFDPVIAGADKYRAMTARALKCDCVLMGETFATYVRRWQHTDLDSEWDTYRLEMIAMVEALCAHLKAEHSAITALVTGTIASHH